MTIEQLDTLRSALAQSPTNIPLLCLVIDALIAAHCMDDAKIHLETLSTLAIGLQDRLFLSDAYFKAGLYEKAGSILVQLKAENGSIPAVLLLLSKVNYQLGVYEQAEVYYLEAIGADNTLKDPNFEENLIDELGRALDIPVQQALEQVKLPNMATEKDSIRFEAVAGMEEVKEKIRMNLIYPAQNQALFAAYGKKAGGGILLYGPPGCGKTYLARATAGECQAMFLNMTIHNILDMYIGASEQNLHQFFETARQYSPAVVFIDELDALGSSRQQASPNQRSLTNQMLQEMDGVTSSNENVLFMAATNAPWYVDPALRRPGRFDHVIFVPPPDLKARAEILKIHLKGKPLAEIDYEAIAKVTERFSGADLQAVCNLATDEVLQMALKSGVSKPIETQHLLTAAKKVRPSTGEWLATAKNYVTYSNQDGQYDDITAYLKSIK